MPPQLALLGCTIFVLFMLHLERRASRDASAALWIPTLWMLIVASRPLGEWFLSPGNVVRNNDSGSAIDRWVLTALALAATIVLVRRRIDWWGSLRRHRWLLLLLVYMALSTFWSDITLIALKRWIREVIVLVMALVVASEVDPRKAFESVVRRTAYVLLPFSLLLIKYYPLLGVQYGKWSGALMWVGVTYQKNQLGRLCMLSIFFLLFALYRRWRDRKSSPGPYPKWADIFVLLLAIYLLKGAENAYSATSLVTIALGVMTFFGLRGFQKMKLRVPLAGVLALVIAFIAFGASTPFLGGANVASFTASLGRDSTLTGRTEVWSDVIPDVHEQPLLGHGFGSFWTDARRERYDIPTAHNGYLDILLELGGVGLVLYTFWALSWARQLHRALAEDYDWASLGICLLLMALLYNVTESALNTLTEQMTAVPAFMTLVLSCQFKPRAAFARYAASRIEARI